MVVVIIAANPSSFIQWFPTFPDSWTNEVVASLPYLSYIVQYK
jgi:hypothetical protein